ncbi:hypothetical protein COLO4_09513 [Corchorus olitorius]|uniref:non-specific serine/threonine protein kinase n=1 Tax=Corchorus olitorius TaxID=93759 RepID=A0A1R3KBT7_9ROSI|nr:hypothetical protein COLO4_09513 [Corchorus olitorius]
MAAVCSVTLFLIFLFKWCIALDTISPSQSLSDGETLVSGDKSFKLGFFSPGSSKNRYVGIWYKKIPVRTIVWVANRQNPINDTSGLLMVNSTGNLVLLSQNQTVVWSSNTTKKAQSPIVQLLDSGNLVLRDERNGDSDSEAYLWQSFDYPTDTLLPGMKLGWDLRTGLDRRLVAWKNSDDPSPGDFSWGIELQYNNPEVVMWKGSKKFYRSGLWNGLGFSGAPELRFNPLFHFRFVSNKDEVFYAFFLQDKSLLTRIVMNQTNYLRQRLVWSDGTWKVYALVPRDQCDSYGLCGAYGSCIVSQSPVCQCLDGFKPKKPEKWSSMDWSEGCLRRKPMNCSNKDGFVKLKGIKVPDAAHSWIDRTMNLRECRAKCLENCSCMAYTNANISGRGSGCVMWVDDLIDIRQIASGQELYVRVSASELKKKKGIEETEQNIEERREDMELPLFDLSTIAKATDMFSLNNKLGEGGFGVVYKDSRLRIIHRDLKASNVLLDHEMNPKISDFGMAKTFGGDQSEGNTNRVVGTYGYMAPEYAIDGLFSVKSDVFSFGILLLEIISGKKNRGFHHQDKTVSLIEHQHPEDRPSMSSVVLMLGGESALPQPNEPGFLSNKNSFKAVSWSTNPESSTNEMTVTHLEAR